VPKIADKPLTVRLVETTKIPNGHKNIVVMDASCPGLGFRKSVTGVRWIMRLAGPDGKRVNSTIGMFPEMSLAQAREYVNAARARRTAGERIVEKPAAQVAAKDGPTTLMEGFQLWYDRHALPHLTRPNGILQHWNRDLEPIVGDWPLETLTRGQMLEALDRLRATKPPATAVAGGRRLASVVNWLSDREYCPPVAHRLKLKNVPSRTRVLSIPEIKQVIGAGRKMGKRPGAVVELLWLSACRAGEVAAFEWSGLNESERVMVLRGDQIKAKEERLVYLSDRAMELMEQARELSGDSKYVFPALRSENDKPYDTTNLPGQLRRKLKWQTGEFRLHDIRRSAASHLARAGFSQEVIKLTLGHAMGQVMSGATGAYVVREAYAPACRDAVDKLSALIE